MRDQKLGSHNKMFGRPINVNQPTTTDEKVGYFEAVGQANMFNVFEIIVGFITQQAGLFGNIVEKFVEKLQETGLWDEFGGLISTCGNTFLNNLKNTLKFEQVNLQQNLGLTNFELNQDDSNWPTEFQNNSNLCPSGRCDQSLKMGLSSYFINCGRMYAELKIYGKCLWQNIGTFVQSHTEEIWRYLLQSLTKGIETFLYGQAFDMLASALSLLFKPLGMIVTVLKAVYELIKEIYDFYKTWRDERKVDFLGIGKILGGAVEVVKSFFGRRRRLMRKYKK